ncbi:MAG: isoprenylcysteine carboxylmethyltransferase family protein [Actinobacteria bacterium]|nr:isoprenylcysteine carboxylmethyltransferase family protein [Actinomycetota bacterium]
MHGFTARGGWWVVGQFCLFGAVLAALVTSGEDWGAWARVLGAAVAAAGAVQAAWGLAALGESLTPFPAPRPGTAMVERGVYRLVRHPIYGGLGIGAAGLGLFDGNPLALWAAAALVLYLWAKSGHEERRLVSHFPDYAAYRTRVPRRLVPWLL